MYAGHEGAVCHFSGSRPYFLELLVLDRHGDDVVPPSAPGFSGDVYPGGGGETSASVPLRTWCRRQPVELKLLGVGPDFPPTRGHELDLRGLGIHC